MRKTGATVPGWKLRLAERETVCGGGDGCTAFDVASSVLSKDLIWPGSNGSRERFASLNTWSRSTPPVAAGGGCLSCAGWASSATAGTAAKKATSAALMAAARQVQTVARGMVSSYICYKTVIP
jgi:hypothetical protein